MQKGRHPNKAVDRALNQAMLFLLRGRGEWGGGGQRGHLSFRGRNARRPVRKLVCEERLICSRDLGALPKIEKRSVPIVSSSNRQYGLSKPFQPGLET